MKKLAPALLFLYMLAGCQKPQSFEYRDLKNFKVDSLGFEQSTISMDLVYFNPNNFGVTLKNVDCDIFIDKKFLGHFKLDTIMQIEKRSEFSLPSKIEVDMKNIYKNALFVLLNKEIELNVKANRLNAKKSTKTHEYFNKELYTKNRYKVK